MSVTSAQWGWKQYFRPTPKKVKEWLIALKGIVASGAVASLYSEKPYWAVGILVAGFFIDEATKFVGQIPEVQAVEDAKQAIKETVSEAAKEILEENESKAEY